MLILSIETSCDETAISLVEAKGAFPDTVYEVLGNGLWSQVDVHREFGGVFPALAKREHAAKIVSMLEQTLTEAEVLNKEDSDIPDDVKEEVQKILAREPGLADELIEFISKHQPLEIDLLAVTSGPGLEPALWVGVNFARALALLWDIPVIPTNHMEGHILAGIYDVDRDNQLAEVEFPAISLLISGGHTELILMKGWGNYEKIGQTRDDAVGEAYDKVARLMGLDYPGGPEVAKRAGKARQQELPPFSKLPTPMLHSGDLDFSFSGLKTAVRYAIRDKVETELSEEDILALSRDFEDAVTTVLIKKTIAAVDEHSAKTIIVGGGVSANTHIKRTLESALLTSHPEVTTYFPQPGLSTDNSVMIALAGHAKMTGAIAPTATDIIRADGNKALS